MGTRGVLGFHINEEDKVTYNHSDSYPSWLGKEVLTFLSDTDMDKLTKMASAIKMVKSDSVPTKKQIKQCLKWSNLSVGGKSQEDWYCLLREAQSNLNAYADGLEFMIDNKSFLLDSLFCEYAYIINIDSQKLEFYVGYNTAKLEKSGRYANLIKEDDSEFFGVALIEEFDLNALFGMKNSSINKIIKKMEKKANDFSNSKGKIKEFYANVNTNKTEVKEPQIETVSKTPKCDELEQLRRDFEQASSPAYRDLMKLAKTLESELSEIKAKKKINNKP